MLLGTKLYGICGKARAGKDTFAEGLNRLPGLQRTSSFAAPIYDMLATFLGGRHNIPTILSDDGKVEFDKNAIIQPYDKSLRWMLQTLGTEWGRDIIHPDIWVMKAQKFIDVTVSPHVDRIVFSDVRFRNEAEFIIRNGGMVVEIVRDDRESIATPNHASEAGILESLIHVRVHNNKSPVHLVNAVVPRIDENYKTIVASGPGLLDES